MFSVGWQEVQRTTSETNQQSFLIWNGRSGLAIKYILWKSLFWDVASCSLGDIYCPWQCGQSLTSELPLLRTHRSLSWYTNTYWSPFVSSIYNSFTKLNMHNTTALQPSVQVLLTGNDWVLVIPVKIPLVPPLPRQKLFSRVHNRTKTSETQPTFFPLMWDTRLLMHIQQAQL